VNRWDAPGGFRWRNLLIARDSDVVHVIVVKDYPPGYVEANRGKPGKVFLRDGKPYCYHCGDRRPVHVKSGACWTAIEALKLGKKAEWHIV
jgi:hypothetical protein